MKVEAHGGLKNILGKWGASDLIMKAVARRAGLVVPGAISHDQIEGIITDNTFNGIPDWPYIVSIIGDAAADAYKGKRIRL